jgi:hypothetical protein
MSDDEYPKMLTKRVGDRIVPMVFAKGHVKHGQHVIFNNAQEEREFDRTSCVPQDAAPEQIGLQVHYPVHMI